MHEKPLNPAELKTLRNLAKTDESRRLREARERAATLAAELRKKDGIVPGSFGKAED